LLRLSLDFHFQTLAPELSPQREDLTAVPELRRDIGNQGLREYWGKKGPHLETDGATGIRD